MQTDRDIDMKTDREILKCIQPEILIGRQVDIYCNADI